jgi:hypothetical protein
MENAVKTVTVLGGRHEIVVYKQKGSLWLASGEFMGQPLQVQAPTRIAAAREWRDVAGFDGHEGGETAESIWPTAFIFMGLSLLFVTIVFGLPVLSRGTPF